jgi:hypothetical protein
MTNNTLRVLCPICGSVPANSTPAVIGTFLKWQMDIQANVSATSWLCTVCHHVFLTPFFTHDKIAKHYQDYDSILYFDRRVKAEPKFAITYGASLNKDSQYYRDRRRWYKKVLDFGDMAGKGVVEYCALDSYFSEYLFPAAERYVLKLGCSNQGGHDAIQTADLLFAVHVLDRISEPFVALTPIVSEMKKGAMAYIEVPYVFHGSVCSEFHAAAEYYDANGAVSESPLVHLDDHLAFFSRRSLAFLMRRCDITVREIYIGDFWIGVLGDKN